MDMNLGHTKLIVGECKAYGCLRNQAAYILATAYWETARTMKPVVEAYWKSEDWRKRNLRYYPWHGRGFVQLTWERNYGRAQVETGFPVHDNPETALEPKPAAAILVKGSMEGWFTGKKIGDYITLKKSDFVSARRVINGTDRARQIAVIAKKYDAELLKLGYGVIDGAKDVPVMDDAGGPDTKAVAVGVAGAAIIGLLASFYDKVANVFSNLLGGLF